MGGAFLLRGGWGHPCKALDKSLPVFAITRDKQRYKPKSSPLPTPPRKAAVLGWARAVGVPLLNKQAIYITFNFVNVASRDTKAFSSGS